MFCFEKPALKSAIAVERQRYLVQHRGGANTQLVFYFFCIHGLPTGGFIDLGTFNKTETI